MTKCFLNFATPYKKYFACCWQSPMQGKQEEHLFFLLFFCSSVGLFVGREIMFRFSITVPVQNILSSEIIFSENFFLDLICFFFYLNIAKT